MKNIHPSIVLEDKNNNFSIALPFTSDKKMSITRDEKDSRYYIVQDCWLTSQIQNQESLDEAKRYYRNEGRYTYAQKLMVGSVCYHFEKNHKSYLTKYCPILTNENHFKYKTIENSSYYYEGEQCLKYKNAIMKGDIEFYLASNKEIPATKIEYLDLCIKNKIDICYKLDCYEKWAFNEKKLNKINFIEKVFIPNAKIEPEEEKIIEKIIYENKLKKVEFEIDNNVKNDNLENLKHEYSKKLQQIEKEIEKNNDIFFLETLTNLDDKEKVPSYEQDQSNFDDFCDDVE